METVTGNGENVNLWSEPTMGDMLAVEAGEDHFAPQLGDLVIALVGDSWTAAQLLERDGGWYRVQFGSTRQGSPCTFWTTTII